MPTPSVSLSQPQPQNPFIGESFDLTLSFDNVGSAVGYGPFAVLFLDTTGADGDVNDLVNGTFDGITLNSATYLGGPIDTQEISLSGNTTEEITVHRRTYTVTVPSGFQAGDTLVAIEIPFGSFVPGQATANVELTFDSSDLADLDHSFNIEAQGGFVFGDSPTGDNGAIIQNTSSTASVTPELVTLTKNYLGPEDETATGPNFPQQYEVVVDVAPGQTITDLDVSDILPDTMQFIDIVSIQARDNSGSYVDVTNTATKVNTPDDGEILGTPDNDARNDGLPTPGGTLTRRIPTVTGTGSRDVVMTVEFFVPRLDVHSSSSGDTTDVIINEVTGDDVFDQNESELGGAGGANQWIPNDGRDGNQTVFIDRNINDATSDPTNPPGPETDGYTDTGFTGYGSDDDSGDEFNDPDHVLEEQSIAIQKYVSNTSGSDEFIPGDILEYRLEFQVSDYFAFEDVFVEDFFSDGQRFFTDATRKPTLTFTEHNDTVSGSEFTFSGYSQVGTSGTGGVSNNGATDYLVIDETNINNNNDGTSTNGETKLTFYISKLLDSLGGQDDQLVGGGVPDGGFAGSGLSLNNNSPLNTNFGGTTGVITFYTEVQGDYSDTYPSGDFSVDAGDKLTNEAIIDGRVLNVDNLQPYDPNTREDDDTSAQLEIASGNLYKSIYAINGEIYDSNNDSVDGFTAAQDTDPSDGLDGYASGIEVSPGDEITYRITYDLPVADIENLTLEDFLPLPAYDVADFDVSLNASYINNSRSNLTNAPDAGYVEYGPAHNFPDDLDTVSTNSDTNSILFDFGDYDDPNNNSAIVDLLITLPIQDEPVADGLLFTNQVYQEQQSTFNEIIEKDAIIQINLLQPNIIDIDKGVVAFSSDNTDIMFDPDPDRDNDTNTTQPSAPSTITFDSNPGATDAFTGTVVSKDANPQTDDTDNLETNPIDSDLDGGLEAGDIVTFAITVENLGKSPRGAFDVVVKDDLPAGFKIPDGNNQLDLTGINLQVKDGNGNPITFERLGDPDTIGDDLFGNGIKLDDDPGVDNDPNTDADNLGAIAGYLLDENGNQTNPGKNIAIITFDLEVDDSGTYQNSDNTSNTAEILTNTATLDGYANTEGGERFSSINTEAEVELESPEAVKSIVTTSEEHTDEVGDGTSSSTGNSTPDANKPRRLAVGEIVRYRLVATIPEGTAKNFQLRDLLPRGLVFLDDNTAKAAFISNEAPITSVTTTDTSFGNTLNTGLGSPGSFSDPLWTSGASASGVTPSFSLPDQNIGSSSTIGTGASGNPDPDVYYSGTDIYFKFGDLSNPDTDEDKEYVIVEFNALVTNDYQINDSGTINTIDGGENRQNSFQINVGTGANFNTPDELVRSDFIYTRIVEPDITLTKEVGSSGTFSTDAFPADSGDTVQFRLTFSNEDNLYRNTTAFEVALTDRVPDGLTLVGIDSIDWNDGNSDSDNDKDPNNESGVITSISSGASLTAGAMEITPTFNVGTNDDISINVDRMPASGSISVIYSATVDGDVNPENLLTNTANITYTSLPGTGTNVTNTSDPNYTGSENTSSTSGNVLGERNGDDGINVPPNDYAATANAQVEIVPLEPVKRLISTTEVSTTDPNVIIGETLRYQLEVTIPEGVSNDFEITDAIPEGLIYAGNTKVAFISSDTGTNTSTGENLGVYSDNPDIDINPQISGATVTTPTFDLDAVPGAISGAGANNTFDDGEDVNFSLGNLTNADRDLDKEYIVIEFDTIVTDVTALENQRIQVNNFSVTSNDNDPKISNDVSVNVVIDYGDAPDTGSGTGEGNYETTDKTGTDDDGAAHGIVDNLSIGSTVDSDDGTLQNDAATADGTDEDGVTFSAVPLNPEVDNSYSVDVVVTNETTEDATLVGWIDFNQNGVFDATEAVTADVGTGLTDANITLTWDRTTSNNGDRNGELPLAENIKSGNTYARFRLSTDGNLTANLATGYAYDGEVEDYQINIGIDYGDAPDTGAGTGDGNYETTDKTDTANDGAAHGIVDNLSIGSTVDRDDGTLENNTATADNLDGDTPNDEDGVTFSINPLDPDDDTSYSVDVQVTNNTTEDATLVGWVDFNQNGVFDSTEAVTANVATGSTDAEITLTWDRDGSNNGDRNGDLPAANDIKTGSTYARFRLSTDPTLNADVSTGFLADGEVEDYQLDIGIDYGDAPDTQSGSVAAPDENTLPDYQTTIADGGASHVVEADNLITIGTSVDTDSGNAQNDTATADGADEEGVFVGTTNNTLSNVNITAFEGNTYSIDVIVNDPVSGQDITLVSWIDFNRNGQFESTEAIARDTNGGLVTDGTTPNTFTFTLPADADVEIGATVARFRVASGLIGDNLSDTTPNGAAPNGEVEDYIVNLVEPASLGSTVFLDNNGNGILDSGESGVSGVTVTLVGGGADDLISTTTGNTTVTTTTDASGNYSFTGLNPGEEYQVTFDESTLPTDHQFTKAGAGTDETKDSDANASGVTPILTLNPGENNLDIDVGIYKPASLGDTLFLDNDNDGVQDTGEPGISGITVTLTGGGTDGLISTTGDNTTTTIVTDASGKYSFTGLTPGEEYQVSFDKTPLPADAAFTTQNASTDGTIDSDVDASGVTPVITFTSGEENLDIDAGIVRPGSIGDTVFIDINNDGIKDGSEPGVSGVTVTLTGGGEDGLISTTTDNTTITTTTNASGNYSFTGLNLEEEYQVSFDPGTLPTDGEFTTRNAGAEGVDSDADSSGVTSIITLSPGENNLDIDAGIIQPASLGDTVFLDNNGDGIQDSGETGVSGVRVTLTGGGNDGLISTTGDNSTVTTTTDASGNYSFTGLNPGEEYQVTFDSNTLPAEHQFARIDVGTDETKDSDADASGVTSIVTLTSGENNLDIDAGILKPASLGNKLFLDRDGDGRQGDEITEFGVGGVIVNLVGGGTDGLISTTDDNTVATTFTNFDGEYSFTGLNPGEEYQVIFDPNNLPSRTRFTKTDIGTDENLDSDADASGITPVLTLVSGEDNSTIDAGIVRSASLGNEVFLDTDGDGIFDSGESGVSGVTVILTGGGDDGLISTTNDNSTATVSTDSSGNYSFTGLNPGEEYQVSFDPNTLPIATKFTKTGVGNNENFDSDVDASGVTPIVTLVSGENRTDVDAGIVELASLGDEVFLDTDGDGIFDSGESGVSDITVTLTGGGNDGLISTIADNTIVTVATDSSGNYSFTGLNPEEEYQVSFDPNTLPPATKFTKTDISNDETADSDADTSGITPILTLSPGEDNITVDAGIVELASVGDTVFLDNDGDGIFDTGESGISGVTVTLTGGGDDGLISTTADNTTVTIATDSSGNYSFTGLNPEEEYQVSFDTSALPTEHQFTKQNEGTDKSFDSDANAFGITSVFTLSPGEDNNNIDAGIFEPASLGNTVFLDNDGDGIFDTEESGVSGVKVTLVGGGDDGNISTTGDNSINTVVTDSSGNYSFTGLTPGVEYQVTFDTNALPTNYKFTKQNEGTDESFDSDADASGVTSIITLTSGEDNNNIDAGIFEPASLGNTVFLDSNLDGIQDSGESGISGVTVTLTGGGEDGNISTTADNTTVTIATDSSGNYSFTGLTPGVEYQVSFDPNTLPPTTKFTKVDATTDESLDSDANASGITPVVTLSSGENNQTIDAGIVELASIGDTVFLDNDGDGIKDTAESGISGVVVTLTGGGEDGNISTTGENTTVTVVTDSSGNYSFTGLNPGEEYQVSFDSSALPADYQFTTQNIGTDESLDSDADENGITPIITLANGEDNTDVDAGIFEPASLGDNLFLDNNGNGIQDGESGVSGVTVTLVGGGDDGLISTTGDNSTVTTTTDASGNYSFTGLNPGEEYQVTFDFNTLPEDHQFTTQNIGTDEQLDSDTDTSGITPIVTLTSAEENNNIDAGILKLASLGNKVFLDNNGNSIFDTGELGVSGVTVTLVGGGDDGLISTTGDNSTVTTTTDASGNYSFTGLNPGEEYQVTFDFNTLPEDHQFTTQNVGTDEKLDSDTDASGVTSIVTLTSGEENNNIDAGILKLASIGNKVFLDINIDGVQDGSETGVSGVVVTLTGGGEDGNISTTSDNTIFTTTTDASGNYSFTGLNPGEEYQVTFNSNTLPDATKFTKAEVGTDGAADSDANASGVTSVVTLSSGENNQTIDAGIVELASVGDMVFLDFDGDGILDAGESGVSGVTVTLTGGGDDENISTTGDNTTVTVVTDSSGNYSFTGLNPGEEYQVSFDTSVLPTDYQFTTQNSGAENVDSDVDSSGVTTTFTLANGENNTDVDAGIFEPASLGDQVFFDTDGDGFQDSADSGVSGVTVILTGGGDDGLISTTTDNSTVTTTTDASGNYSFTGLNPGKEYQVTFDPNTLPTNAQFTTADIFANALDNSDSDASSSGVTPIVTLTSGESDQTIDAGIIQTASIGDTVFFDTNEDGIKGNGESGVSGVTVTLTGGGDDGLISTTVDNSTVTTTTDASGSYSFTGLKPGEEYQVTFEKNTLPANYRFTTQNALGNNFDSTDSDADNLGVTPIVTLSSGENNLTIDAGIIPKNAVTGSDNAEVIDTTTTIATTNGDDLIIGNKGEDTLTGAAGDDCYYFNETSDGVDTITDFVPASDQIDLSNILANEVTAYTGGDPFAQGFVELTEFTHPISGITSTIVQIDFDAGNELYPKDVVVLQGILLSSLDTSRDFII